MKRYYLLLLLILSTFSFGQNAFTIKVKTTSDGLYVPSYGDYKLTVKNASGAPVSGYSDVPASIVKNSLNTDTNKNHIKLSNIGNPSNGTIFILEFLNNGATPLRIRTDLNIVGGFSRPEIQEIVYWGSSIKWDNDMSHFMYNASELKVIASDIPNFTNVTNMSNMFSVSSRALTEIKNIGKWDVSSVKDMSGMFSSAYSFLGVGLNEWGAKTKQVTNMSEMFSGCTDFNLDISTWDTSNVENMSYMFNLTSRFNQNISNWNVGKVKNMSHMFNTAVAFDQPLGNWDVQNVTDMKYMFTGADLFDQNISNWNVGKVKDMTGMFTRASKFNSSIHNWNVSNVENMSGMFTRASEFTGTAIGNWNVSKVQNMSSMFNGAEKFNGDIGKWGTKTGNVTEMTSMFEGAKKFNQPIGSWNVSRVNNFTGMFKNATAFNQDISNWTFYLNLINLSSMFEGASNFNQDLSNWNVSKIRNMSKMFKGASKFKQDLSGWDFKSINTTAGESLDEMLLGTGIDCTNFSKLLNHWNTTIGGNAIKLGNTGLTYNSKAEVAFKKLKEKWTIGTATYRADCGDGESTTDPDPDPDPDPENGNPFVIKVEKNSNGTVYIPAKEGEYSLIVKDNDGNKLTGTVSGYYFTPTSSTESTFILEFLNKGTTPLRIKADLDETSAADIQDITNWGDVTWSTDMSFFMAGAINLTMSAEDIPDFSSVTDMSAMFLNASNFNGSISDWNVSSVNDMSYMFSGAVSFDQNLIWEVDNVTNMEGIFKGATSFSSYIKDWDVRNVENMISMFEGASGFNQDLAGWVLYGNPNASMMFKDAISFNRDISSWKTRYVKNMSSMFEGAIAFNQNISSWQTDNTESMYRMFYGASSFNQDLGAFSLKSIKTSTTANTNSMNEMLLGSALDCDNFSKSLIGWREYNTKNIYLGETGLKYNETATAAYNSLKTKWNIEATLEEGCGMPIPPFILKVNKTNNGVYVPVDGEYLITVKNSSGHIYDPVISNNHITNLPSSGTYTLEILNSETSPLKISTNTTIDETSLASIQEIASWGNVIWSEDLSNFMKGAKNVILTATGTPDFSNVTNMSSMFEGATKFNGNISDWNVWQATNMSAMFKNASVFNQDISSWEVPEVADMSSMFEGATAFNQELNKWSTINVKNMSAMFKNAKSFNADLNNWKTGGVENMSSMFEGATKFNGNLNNWDVDYVKNMSAMFKGAIAFNQELDQWNINQVTNTSAMFEGAITFDQDIENWNTSQVTNMANMFKGATEFNQNLENWKLDNINSVSGQSMDGMLTESGMNCINFSKSLNGWFKNNTAQNIILGDTGLEYNRTAITTVDKLTNERNWTFTATLNTNCGLVGECTQPSITGDIVEEIPSFVISTFKSGNLDPSKKMSNSYNGFVGLKKGFVLPRVNKSEDVSTPIEGMLIYEKTDSCIKLYSKNEYGVFVWKCVERTCNTLNQ